MLLSEREEKRKERVVAAAAWGWGGDYTRWYQAKAHESVSTAV